MVSLRLMPRDVKFFDLLIADGENLLAAARELRALMDSYDDVPERIARIQALEHAGDEIGDEIEERLEDAFITPIDRGDIHDQRLSAILEEQAIELDAAFRKFESMKDLGGHLRRVHVLENEADSLSRTAIGRLFRDSQDPLEVIKWRDIYQSLEESIDAAEDVAEIIQRVIHKGS